MEKLQSPLPTKISNSRPQNVNQKSIFDLPGKKKMTPMPPVEGNIENKDVKLDIPNSVKTFSHFKKEVDKAAPLDNSEKMDRIQAQIARGEYSIDYDALADKILRNEF